MTPTPSASDSNVPPDGWFIYTVKQLEMGLRAPLETATSQQGLSAAQFTALAVLARWPGISSSELARRSFMRAQSMAETLAPLLERGLVHREPDPGHRRRYLLSLSADGEQVLDAVNVQVAALEAQFLKPLTSRERASAARLLRRLRAGMAPQ